MSVLRTSASCLAAILAQAHLAHAANYLEEFPSVAESADLAWALLVAAQDPGGADEVSVTADGEWMVVTDSFVERSAGFPSVAKSYVDWYRYWGRTIDAVAVSPQGGVVVSAEDMLYVSPTGIPWRSRLYDQLDGLRDAGITIRDVTFDPDGVGWAIAAGEDSVTFAVDPTLVSAFDDAAEGRRQVHGVSMADDGRWAVLAGDWFQLHDGSIGLHDTLRAWAGARQTLDRVVLGPDGFVLAETQEARYVAPALGIDQIDSAVFPGTNIWRRMDQLGITGVSIAVIDGDQVTSRSYGYADSDTLRHLTPGTPIEAASLSKAVASMGMLALADNSMISLNDDLVTDIVPRLDPASDFVDYLDAIAWSSLAPPSGIELRMLLNHTAGLNYNSGSPRELMSRSPKPMEFRLKGYSCNPIKQICSTSSWTGMRSGASPGDYDYSATGYLWAQAVLEGVTGQPMAEVIQERVLDPLGMDDTTFDTAFVASHQDLFSYTHAGDGTPIKGAERSAYRWLGAGGMYSTPRDLARFLQTIDAGGTTPDGGFVVSSAAIEQLLTGSDENPNYALGLRRSTCNHVTETDRPGEIWHGGKHSEVVSGRSAIIQHEMRYRPALDQGIVVMVNGGGRVRTSPNGPWRDAAAVITSEIVARFRSVYGWGANNECTQVPTPPAPIVPGLPGGGIGFP